jgi:hypothetical protein
MMETAWEVEVITSSVDAIGTIYHSMVTRLSFFSDKFVANTLRQGSDCYIFGIFSKGSMKKLKIFLKKIEQVER